MIPGKHLGGWGLLPAAPGKCQTCAVDHPPEMPHNAQSMFYQYAFFNEHGRWPNWKDAMQHCTPEVRERWGVSLKEMGVDFEAGEITPKSRMKGKKNG